VIYVPHSADNEAQGAAWTTHMLLAADVAEGSITRIPDSILATQHQVPPDLPDAALMVDSALAILV
jgi:predicted metal-dependent HD superfamily phosphohydrolase